MKPSLAFQTPFIVRNMLRRWRKSLGATFGVGVALMIVVALLGVAKGGTYVYSGEYVESTADLYSVTRGGAIVSILPGEGPGTIDRAGALLSQIRAMPGVRQVVGLSFTALGRDLDRTAAGKRRSENWFTVGVDGDPSSIAGMLDMKSGRWLRLPNEIVLASRLAELKNIKVDDVVTLQERRLRVVGIGHINGASFAGLGAAYLDSETLQSLSGEGDLVSIVIVASNNPAATAERMRDVRQIDVYSRDEVEAKVTDLMNSAVIFYYLFSLLGLAIAALFVANVLTMSVATRRVEFATLRAIGVPSGTIVFMIVGEALIIAILAYGLGAVLGTVVGLFLNTLYAPLVKVDQFVVFDSTIYLQVLAIALSLSVVAALLPARSALRIQPIEALREA